DDESHVRWRSFESLLEHIGKSLSSGRRLEGEALAGDLDPADLTEPDFQAGRSMLEFAGTLELHSAESPMAYTFAFDLLGDGQVTEIAAFLEHEDMFVARAARDRLTQLKSEQAKIVLKNFQQELSRLKSRCADLFRLAGRQVTVEGDDFRVESMGLDWEAIYSQRRRPDFEQWVAKIGRRVPS
ncbi:MAG TPA: hypothetical protein VMZ27_11175, partial [Candidatus Saccharimonadales bacterium]|nr:hypothetical protein [Candidatus Saccharimonadales bacterium]